MRTLSVPASFACSRSAHWLLQWSEMLLPLLFLTSWALGKAFAPTLERVAVAPAFSRATRSNGVVLFYEVSSDRRQIDLPPHDRFKREAPKETHIEEPCIIFIHGNRYNLTAWANAHPGGANVLLKLHGRDATKAFEGAHHSAAAYAMLKDFCIEEKVPAETLYKEIEFNGLKPRISKVRHKLFTKEDPIGVHKYLGLFCLINFFGRFWQMLFADPAAGLGTRGHPWFSLACLLPHAMLSLSSLIFHTVPKERVVGKPMIWKEFRVHNIIFGVRAVLTAVAASLAIRAGHTPLARQLAVSLSCACVLLASIGADVATNKLRSNNLESTTATMPYWEGCSMQTQKRFKSFYAYSQFMATLACLVS